MTRDESQVTNNAGAIPDADARRLAETTFDRNVVVVAGAGTGKTTLLVNRFVHTLMRPPAPATIMQVIALTFTNKAATEMKVRLRERLAALRESGSRDEEGSHRGFVRGADLRAQYGLSTEEISDRARAALQELEKAQIGTLHSFAAHLLRLFPIESGVDPGFQEDDGTRFEEHFAAQWELWLDGELGPDGKQQGLWRRLLGQLGLEQLRGAARALCNELVPLETLAAQGGGGASPPALRDWLAHLGDRAAKLLAAHDRPERRKIESVLAASADALRLLVERGVDGLADLAPEERDEIGRDLGSRPPIGWSDDDFAEAQAARRVAQAALASDRAFVEDLLTVLAPFARRVRTGFLEEGWISFDGLLAKASALLREHPAIRERLKREYRAILVDEFQDTDPVQYEILLFLAERPGRCAPSWREVDPEPGKLFIVGDPKQSIYAFRRADIEAFDRVVRKLTRGADPPFELVTNFRSHARVLESVNVVFDRLFRAEENVQPPNVPLAPRPDRRGGAVSPGVEVRLIVAEGEEAFDAATATRVEAEQLAAWLKDELMAGERLTDSRGSVRPIRPGDVALLFRKLTQAQEYLDALRRHGIDYLTDGEKHFYRRQEVVDVVNLLRLVENPHDGVALAGLLRSPLGGVTDRELYELRERGAFDYRQPERLDGWTGRSRASVRSLYERLREVAREAARRPLPEVLDLLYARLPVLELAAASLHKEQAVANLLKVRELAAALAARPHLTLTGFVDLMIGRLAEQPEEAESALAEESPDAVRVLTIHKAKGLEFPVVILPGLHHGPGGGGESALVAQDWSSGVWGIAVGEKQNLGAVLVREKMGIREEAEQRRVFYVGMTRARERLILSGGLTRRPSPGSLLALLAEASGEALGDPACRALKIGAAAIPQTVLTLGERVARTRAVATADLAPDPRWTEVAQRWERRDRVWEEMCAVPRALTPSRLAEMKAEPAWPIHGAPEAERARVLGTLAHRVLERWDFRDDPAKLADRIDAACRVGVPKELESAGEEIRDELRMMFTTFADSASYADLRRATILGREVPFAIRWDRGIGTAQMGSQSPPQSSVLSPQSCVMHGVIDLIYRLDGRLWIADYKTDRLAPEEMPERVATYRPQAHAYVQAVVEALGERPAGFNFVLLRSGRTVTVEAEPSPGQREASPS